MEITTYKELASLKQEELDAYSPEEMEALKTSVGENEATLATTRESELTKAKEDYESQKIRAEKAESKVKKGEDPKEVTPKEDPKSNEPDYARLAFLEQKGVVHPDDKKVVQDEAERLKLPLTDVLGMEHIKAQLKTSKETREAAEGMPKGNGRAGGKTQHDVDFWKDKQDKDGQYETPDDQQLAEKVIDARIAKENNNKFSDSLY